MRGLPVIRHVKDHGRRQRDLGDEPHEYPGFHHVYLSATDRAATLAFYGDVMGALCLDQLPAAIPA